MVRQCPKKKKEQRILIRLSRPLVRVPITVRRASSCAANRRQLLAEQKNKCPGLMVCGRPQPCKHPHMIPTECDHIWELRWGGRDCIRNLQMLCHPCHTKKTKLNYKLWKGGPKAN